jgi:uncharacterized membrane protein YbhN (UPF0104 family)
VTSRPRLRAEPIASPPEVSLPSELDTRRLLRRALQVVALLVVLLLGALLAPGLGEVRHLLAGVKPGWVVLAIALEVLSCLSYVLMFRPVFCPRMSARTTTELALSELAVGALVPAGGAGGLALGAWALSRGGMPAERIATRSVAFFLIKSAPNFFAVAIIGALLGVGVLGPALSPALTLLPAALAAAVIAAVVLVGRAGRSWSWTGARGGRVRRAAARTLVALTAGAREATRILRRGDAAVLAGSIGYWAFDNAMLWASFHALGESPSIAVILMGYLLGQLGGLLPLPGGLGGVDGGLIGALIVYGTPAASATAAVLLYRVIVFWIPILMGAPAFASLQRGLNRPDRPDLCAPPVPA